MSKNDPKRISYKSRYLETEEKLTAKNKQLERLKQETSCLKEKVKELKKELAISDEESREYLDHLRRLKADFENYKKRMVKERQQILNWAVEDLIKEFLPVLDDLERAIDSAKISQDFPSLIEGIEMVHDHFKHLLEKKGLQKIPAEGEEFNPYVHEAIMSISSNEHPDNIVVEEVRKGYRFKDKVLRPAMVKVNKRKPPCQTQGENQGKMEV